MVSVLKYNKLNYDIVSCAVVSFYIFGHLDTAYKTVKVLMLINIFKSINLIY